MRRREHAAGQRSLPQFPQLVKIRLAVAAIAAELGVLGCTSRGIGIPHWALVVVWCVQMVNRHPRERSGWKRLRRPGQGGIVRECRIAAAKKVGPGLLGEGCQYGLSPSLGRIAGADAATAGPRVT